MVSEQSRVARMPSRGHGRWLLGLLCLVSSVAGATVISSLDVTPPVVTTGQPVRVTVTAQSTADAVSDARLEVMLYRGDQLLDSRQLDNVQINTGTDANPGITRFDIHFSPDRYRDAGRYRVEATLSGVDSYNDVYSNPDLQSPGSAVFTSTRVAYFTVQGEPVALSVSRLQIEGRPGASPTGSFQILSGTPPFTLTSANEEGRGTFSNDQPGLNETVVYAFRIPSGATDQDQFSDLITIRGADGVEITLPVTITVTRQPSQDEIEQALDDIARTPPQKEVGKAIGILCPSGAAEPRLQQDCNLLVGASLDPAGADQAARALAQITADQVQIPVDAAQTSILSQTHNVGTRLAALRGGALGVSVRGLALQIDGQRLPLGRMVAALGDALRGAHGGSAGSDALLENSRLGVFLNGAVSGGNKDRSVNEAGFDFDVVSLTLGMDYRFSDQWLAGVALGYSRNNTDLDQQGGYLDSDGYSISLYGSWFRSERVYLDGILTWGRSSYDQARRIRYQIDDVAVNQTAYADFDGSQWSAVLGGGYLFTQGPWSVTPNLRLEYIRADIDGFDERMSRPQADGGGWAVHVGDRQADSFTSQVGLDLAYVTSQSWGVLVPALSIEWVHEFKDNPGGVAGHFLQDTSRTLFLLPTDDYDSDYFNLGVGASAQFANGWSGFVRYRQLIGYSGLDAWTLHVGIRMEF